MPARDVRAVGVDEWVDAAAAALAEGWVRFDWLGAVDEVGRADEVRILLRVEDAAGARALWLETRVPRDGGTCPTVTGAYPGAAWGEREVQDFFGVRFEGGDPAPLLLPPGFPGHPLRKDEPLPERESRPQPVPPRGRRGRAR